MRSPIISICLPVLNARRFLPERLDSIFQQSFTDWELIVVEGYSEDGSWEYIQERCSGDPRARLEQAPRQGIYAAINLAISRAQGSWIYIATADDSMDARCLEKLLALGGGGGGAPCIAQCGLVLVDEESRPLAPEKQWPRTEDWHSAWGERFQVAHQRRAPFDGAAVMVFGTLITSLTQALFPREVFERMGAMPGTFKGAGDMAWEGLAGFFHDVRYSPERLATWRIHGAQATAAGAAGYHERNAAIADWLLEELRQRDAHLAQRAEASGLSSYRHFAQIRHEGAAQPSCLGRVRTMLRLLTSAFGIYISYLRIRILRQDAKMDASTVCRLQAIERFLDGDSYEEGPMEMSAEQHSRPWQMAEEACHT